MKILQVEKILRSEGVALGGYPGNYEFWNMKQHQDKNIKGYLIGCSTNLKGVLERYKDFTDKALKY